MANEGRFLRVKKNPIESFSITIGNVSIEFNADSGFLTYNRKMTNLVINGEQVVGSAPDEGDNGENGEIDPVNPRKRGKKSYETPPVTE